MDTLGSRLKKLRKREGFTQKELAEKLLIDHSSISKYETRNVIPESSLLQRMADLFNVSIDYLLCRTDISTPPLIDESWKPTLTQKDHKDLDKILLEFEEGLAGTIMMDGEILDETTKELFLQSVRNAHAFAKLNNKAKYTPKKYRK